MQRPAGNTTQRRIALALGAALLLQAGWVALRPALEPEPAALPRAPGAGVLRLLSLGEEEALAKITVLWLQAFDNQPGISLAFDQLDYPRLIGWLAGIAALDPQSQYPHLLASRLYSDVPDSAKRRAMMEFVFEQYRLDPGRRWPWLVHVAMLAKHRERDLALALKYARALADTPDGINIPPWARQMDLIILEEMGELDAARLIAGGLISSGRITDARELQFLKETLIRLERAAAAKSSAPPHQP